MPPKSLQPSAVWERQTPVVNKRPETDARNRPPKNLRKLPALRADVVANSARSGVKALSCLSSSLVPYPSFPPKRAKNRSFRSSASSHRTRFAGLRREPWCPRNLLRKGDKRLSNPSLGLGLHPARSGRTQRHTGANTGRFGWSAITTLGSCCGLSNSPGAGVRTACFPVHALCPSPDGMNWMPSFSAFALAFCCAAARSAFSNCRS